MATPDARDREPHPRDPETTVRDAEPADGTACAAIYGPFVADTPVSFEEVPPTAAEMARLIERISARYPWLVAERDDAVIGFAYASPHRARPAYRWAVDVTVYVDAQHRGRGVGAGLYRTLLHRLTRQGFHAAVAVITLPNPASVALHESMGFARVGVFRRIGYKAGNWWDVGTWQLELCPPQDGAPEEPGPPRGDPELSR